MSKKKVWVMGDGLDFPQGNASTNRLTEIAKGFIANGYDTKLIPLQNSKIAEGNVKGKYKGVEYDYLSKKRNIKISKVIRLVFPFVYYVKKRRLLKAALKEDGVSIIFCGTATINSIIVLYFLSREFGIKFIYDIVEEPYATWVSRKFNDFNLRHKARHIRNLLNIPMYYLIGWRLPDYLTCISVELKNKLLKYYFCSENIYILPIVKYFSSFPQRGNNISTAYNPHRLVHSGSNFISKDGIDVILDAIKIVNERGKNIYIDFYGPMDTVNKKKILTIVKKNKIDKYVTIKGLVPYEDLFNAQKQALALICFKMNTKQNKYNMATKIIDYLDSGRPVILSRLAIYDHYFKNQVDVLIAKDNSSVELANIIEFVVDNQVKANKIGGEGNHTLYKLFNSSVHIQRILTESLIN